MCREVDDDGILCAARLTSNKLLRRACGREEARTTESHWRWCFIDQGTIRVGVGSTELKTGWCSYYDTAAAPWCSLAPPSPSIC